MSAHRAAPQNKWISKTNFGGFKNQAKKKNNKQLGKDVYQDQLKRKFTKHKYFLFIKEDFITK